MTAQGPRFPELHDEAWVRDAYETQGLSGPQIAAELGCHPSSVETALNRFGIATRDVGGHWRRYEELHNEAWVRNAYENRGLSMSEIAAEVGCSKRAVEDALDRFGVPRRPRGGRAPKYPKLHDARWLRTQYVERGRSRLDIAEEVGCSRDAVRDALAKHGIATVPGSGPAARFDALRDAAWLRVEYVERGRSQASIAAEIGCSQPAVGQALARHGIPSRRHS